MALRDIRELADANATDTSTTQISEVQGEKWLSELLKIGENITAFENYITVNTSLIGKGDDSISIPITNAHLTMTAVTAENTERTWTELTNLDTVKFTPTWSKYGVTISKEIDRTSRVDLVKHGRFSLAEDIAQVKDTAIATALQGAAVTQRVYGGDATGPDDLAAGDKLTTDLIADARKKIRASNFVPDALFIRAEQEGELLKDGQFVDASEFGSGEIVKSGQIGRYLGMDVIVTEQTPTYAGTETDINENTKAWAVAGDCCIMTAKNKAGQKAAAGIAYKEKPTLDYWYNKNKAQHEIYLDVCYQAKLLQPKAVCLLKVANA